MGSPSEAEKSRVPKNCEFEETVTEDLKATLWLKKRVTSPRLILVHGRPHRSLEAPSRRVRTQDRPGIHKIGPDTRLMPGNRLSAEMDSLADESA